MDPGKGPQKGRMTIAADIVFQRTDRAYYR